MLPLRAKAQERVAISCLQIPHHETLYWCSVEVCFGANSTILAKWGDIDKVMYETSFSNETVSGLVKDIQNSTTDLPKHP